MSTFEVFERSQADSKQKLILLQCDSLHEIVAALQSRIEGTFVCLVVADFGNESVEELVEWTRNLIKLGSRYFCAWGPACKSAHHAFDWACSEFEPDSEGVIPTTDHNNESIEDAIWYALNCAIPVSPYDQDWRSIVSICVNAPDAVFAIRSAFSNPEDFIDRTFDP